MGLGDREQSFPESPTHRHVTARGEGASDLEHLKDTPRGAVVFTHAGTRV